MISNAAPVEGSLRSSLSGGVCELLRPLEDILIADRKAHTVVLVGSDRGAIGARARDSSSPSDFHVPKISSSAAFRPVSGSYRPPFAGGGEPRCRSPNTSGRASLAKVAVYESSARSLAQCRNPSQQSHAR
jgi:hypothetical protein